MWRACGTCGITTGSVAIAAAAAAPAADDSLAVVLQEAFLYFWLALPQSVNNPFRPGIDQLPAIVPVNFNRQNANAATLLNV